jgi:hypothetical protein
VLDEQSDDAIDSGTAENQAEDCVSNDDLDKIVSRSESGECGPEAYMQSFGFANI